MSNRGPVRLASCVFCGFALVPKGLWSGNGPLATLSVCRCVCVHVPVNGIRWRSAEDPDSSRAVRAARRFAPGFFYRRSGRRRCTRPPRHAQKNTTGRTNLIDGSMLSAKLPLTRWFAELFSHSPAPRTHTRGPHTRILGRGGETSHKRRRL